MILWRKPRNPPSIAACALDPGVDATAAARSKLRSRLPFTAVNRMVHRPQHLHDSSPSTLDARVPAIQRPSARSHRTVDNSLITGRIHYRTSKLCRVSVTLGKGQVPKYLPSVTLGKRHSAKDPTAMLTLPSVGLRALGKHFVAECPDTRQSIYVAPPWSGTLPSV